jgi:hypothetical protein
MLYILTTGTVRPTSTIIRHRPCPFPSCRKISIMYIGDFQLTLDQYYKRHFPAQVLQLTTPSQCCLEYRTGEP